MTTPPNFDDPTDPSTAALQQFVSGQLSFRSRAGHVALLLGALMMTVAIGSLWATERALPIRTQAAFGGMMFIGLSWSAFAIWVLTFRRPLYARHQVIASTLAVIFTTVFVIATAAVALVTGGKAPMIAGGAGVIMLAVATAMLTRARRIFANLAEQRAALERQIA